MRYRLRGNLGWHEATAQQKIISHLVDGWMPRPEKYTNDIEWLYSREEHVQSDNSILETGTCVEQTSRVNYHLFTNEWKKKFVRLHFSLSIISTEKVFFSHVLWCERNHFDMGIPVLQQVTHKMHVGWANKLLTILLTETMFNKRFFFSLFFHFLFSFSCFLFVFEHKWENRKCADHLSKPTDISKMEIKNANAEKGTHTQIKLYPHRIVVVQCDWIDDFCGDSFYFRSDKKKLTFINTFFLRFFCLVVDSMICREKN